MKFKSLEENSVEENSVEELTMGMNYYKRLLPDEETIIELKALAESLDFEGIREIERRIKYGDHICKMSRGWSIFFDAHGGKFFSPTRTGLDFWLRQKGKIVDELGTVFTVDEFWKEVDEWNNDSVNWRNSRTHQYDTHMSHREEDDFWTERGFEVVDSEFISDGLIFTTYTDFC